MYSGHGDNPERWTGKDRALKADNGNYTSNSSVGVDVTKEWVMSHEDRGAILWHGKDFCLDLMKNGIFKVDGSGEEFGF